MPARPTSTDALGARLQLRKRGWPLVATKLLAPQQVTLADGVVKGGHPGDYLVATTSGVPIDLVSPEKLFERYEVLQETLSVSKAAQRTLEDRLGLGACVSEASLLAAVERATKIGVGGVDFGFTPGQLEEIAYRASKRDRTLAQELQTILDTAREYVLYGTAR